MAKILELPLWIQDLRTQLTAQDETVRKKATANFFGLPAFENYPKPSDVRAWDLKNWAAWAKANGFTEGEVTKHATKFTEPVFGEISLGVAHTPSDWRSYMNQASDFRSHARTCYEMYGRFAVDVISCLSPSSAIKIPEKVLTDVLNDGQKLAAYTIACYRNQNVRIGILDVSDQDVPYSTPAEFRRLITVAKTEFGADMNDILARTGIDAESRQKIMKTIDLVGDDYHVPQPLMGRLRDALELLRAESKAEQEEKLKQREVAEAERIARAADRAKPTTRYKAEVDALKKAIADRLDAVGRASRAALTQLENATTQINAMAFPELPSGLDELPAITALKAENVQLKEQLGEIPRLKLAVSELEKYVQDDPWRRRLKVLAELVSSGLSDQNLSKLVAAIPELKAKAKEELDAVKDANKKAVGKS